MRKLLKYDYRRDFFTIGFSLFSAILLIAIILQFNILGPKDTDLIGLLAIIGALPFFIILCYKIQHLSEDTVVNREHGMLIPKTPLQIVLSNSIVTFSYCCIAPILAGVIQKTAFFNLRVLLSLKFYITVLLLASVIFFFYIYFTWFYIFILKIFKKPSTAQNIVVLVILISFIIMLISGGIIVSFKLIGKNLVLSGILTVLLSLLGILGVSATVGHKFTKEKLETKALYIISILSLITSISILVL